MAHRTNGVRERGMALTLSPAAARASLDHPQSFDSGATARMARRKEKGWEEGRGKGEEPKL